MLGIGIGISPVFNGVGGEVVTPGTIIAGTGGFDFSGQDVTLRKTYQLVAGNGAFSFTGDAATLTRSGGAVSYTLTADSGSFSFAGSNMTPVTLHVMAAASGSFSFAGQDVTLTKSSSTTTWNPSDKNAGIALSNGNLTATRSGGSGDAGVRSIASTSTAKVYWEITANTLTNTNNAFGIANSTWNLTWVDGSFNNAGSWGLNALLPYSSGDVIGVALDATARKVWYRVNGGSWGPSGDPAAGTGGRDISTLTGALYALVFSNPNGDGHTANFGATAYANSAPSGFGNWS